MREAVKRLAFIALIIAVIDNLQGYYMQQVMVNPYSEANAIPAGFYHYGFLGYVAYIPIDFATTLGLFVFLWAAYSLIVYLARAGLRGFKWETNISSS
jgi:hypothetical protein